MGTRRNKTRRNKTRRNRMKGWSVLSPSAKERTKMMSKCGKKCFLGPKKSFPICARNTCTINEKGTLAAFTRARQYRKRTIAKNARKTLRRMKWI